MAINNCSPANNFGPIQQHLLLGCSIVSLSCNLGYGEQASSVSVVLAHDPCFVPAGGRPKVYYDVGLNRVETTDPDPGFFPTAGHSVIGTPCYLRWGDFEYCGLIKTWQASEGSQGTQYTVQIVDPREILEGVQLIIGDYAGGVGNAYNVFNVYGFLESFGSPCPLTDYAGATWGTPAGGFGGAQINENGMRWNNILFGVKILTSSFPKVQNIWSTYGRVLFKGSSIAGYGLFLSDHFDIISTQDFPGTNGYLAEYYLDLSELPIAPADWRFSGTTITLMEAVSQICDDAGCDYYVELVPVKLAGTILKIIKVRVVSRRNQINLTSVANFLITHNGLELQTGRELRNAPTTSILVGGYKQHIYQAEQDIDPDDDDDIGVELKEVDNIIHQFWGLDPSGNAIIATGLDHNSKQFPFNIKSLHNQIPELAAKDTVDINVGQLRAALLGKDAWESYITLQGHHFATGLGIQGLYALRQDIADILINGGTVPHDWVVNKLQNTYNISEEKRNKIDLLYKIIHSYANTYYGKKYMVRLPYSCVRIDPETGQEFVSEEPSDGGWTDDDSILGLPNNTIWTDFFKLEDNRIQPFVYFGNVTGVDYGNLDPNTYIFFSGIPYIKNPNFNPECVDPELPMSQQTRECAHRYIQGSGTGGVNLYVKADIEKQLVYRNYAERSDPRVVITLGDKVATKVDIGGDRKKLQILVSELLALTHPSVSATDRLAAARRISSTQIGQVITNEPGDGTYAADPDAIAVPLKSNIDTYGPWIVRGPAGATKLEHDESLVPWNYGNEYFMHVAGLSKVTESVTFQQVLERGSISIAGFPNVPLGAELGAVINGFFNGNNQLFENRFALTETLSATYVGQGSSTSFDVAYVQFGRWNGDHGPNVTAVDIQIQGQGVSTTYNFQTFTPQFGYFSKNNAERLKKIGNLRLNQQKRARARSFQNTISDLRKNGGGPKFLLPPSAEERSTPSRFLIAQQYSLSGPGGSIDTYKAHEVLLHDPKQVATELGTGIYPNVAMMSLDGMFRAVSMSGDGGLPRYANILTGICNPGIGPKYTYPPGLTIDRVDDGDANSINKFTINRNYLNPFTNPIDVAASIDYNFSNQHVSSNQSAGHDIDFLSRNANPPTGHHSFRHASSGDGYSNDYRFLALRGPLIIHGWGYDTDGKPVPNAADVENAASSGIFTDSGLTDYFMPDFLRRSHCWPVAPVDLRFDRARGVWVSPPPYKLVVGSVASNPITPFGSGVANWVTGGIAYDYSGGVVNPHGRFDVRDVLGQSLSVGTRFISYYDTDSCSHVILSTIPSGSSISIGRQSGCASVASVITPTGGAVSFSSISLLDGFTLYRDGSNSVQIGLNIRARNEVGCTVGGVAVSSSGFSFNSISVYSGLALSDNGSCTLGLATDLKMLHVQQEASGASELGAAGHNFVRIGLLSGMVGYAINDCQINIGPDLDINTIACNLVSGTTLPTTPAVGLSHLSIAVGNGLTAKQIGARSIAVGVNPINMFGDSGVYDANQDLILKAYSNPGLCDLVSIFFDASSVDNYNQDADQTLGHVSGGGWYWFDFIDCSGSGSG